jgi:hypothetical protein
MTHTLNLEIDYAHEHGGWIDCDLIVDEEHHHLDATAVFPPFLPLLYFVRAVAGQRFPSKFYWEEEGPAARFEATAVDEDGPRMHLKIQHSGAELPWIDADIERETVLRAFLLPLLDLDRNYLVAETEWGFPHQIVDSIQIAIANGIPLPSEIDSPRPVEIVVKGGYGVNYIDGHVFIHVTVDDYPQLYFLLHDTDPFWQNWVDFLGEVAKGNLPAQCEHLRVETYPEPDQSSSEEYRVQTRFSAEALDHPDNFRLRIYTRTQEEDEFLLVDEVVNRGECAHGFTSTFRKFLREEYRLVPDNDGNTFDLRTLSLEKLD